MRRGDRITYQGRQGMVVETKQVTPGMIDIRLDGDDFTRRARQQDVSSFARKNGPDPNVTIPQEIRRSGGGVFTRPDPPRFGRDGVTYCGNPIDGTAYYLAVSTGRLRTSRFISWQEVLDGTLTTKRGLPAPQVVLEESLEYTTTRGALLERVRNYIDTLNTPEPNKQIIYDMVSYGVALSEQSIPEDQRTIAGIEVRPSEFDSWEQFKGNRIGAKMEVRITVPTVDTIKAATKYYTSTLVPKLTRSRRVKIFIHRPKFRVKTRLKQTAKARRGRKGPEREQFLHARGTQDVTYEEVPGFNFAKVEKGSIGYPRVVQDRFPGAQKLSGFQAYARQGFKNTTKKNLTVEEVLTQIPIRVIEALFASDMIYISGKEGPRQRRRSLFLAEPGDVVEPGDSVIIENKEKAESPFFSWVKTIVPAFPERTGEKFGRCLTPEDRENVETLRETIKSLERVRSAFGRLPKLFRGLRKATGRKTLPSWDAPDIFSYWRDSLTSLERLRRQLDPEFELDPDIENFLGRAAELGLVGPEPLGEVVSKFVSRTAREPVLGRTGLMFLSGDTDVHPLDDFFFWVQRGGVKVNKLNELRKDADITALTTRVPTPRRDQEGSKAWSFGEALRLYASREQKRVQATPVEKDMADAVSLLLFDIYRERQLGDYDLAGIDDELRNLLVLTMFYYAMGAYYIIGPLSSDPKGETPIAREIKRYESITSEILGGKPLGTAESYTLYMTYNPVLFETTRLYWPTRDASDPRWKGILSQAPVLGDLDAVGRYGVAAEIMQRVVHLDETEAEASKTVFETVGTETGFMLLWPLGETEQEAVDELQGFAASPVEYVGELKQYVNAAVPRLILQREAGLPAKKDLLADPVLRAIVNEEAPPLNPADVDDFSKAEKSALRKVQQALEAAQSVDITTGRFSERLRKEEKALKDFQRKPGPVRRRDREGIMRLVQLKSIPVTGLYDRKTLLALSKKSLAPRLPPGERVYGGQTNTPYLMPKRGEKPLGQDSVLAKMEKRRTGLKNWIELVDQMLAVVNQQLGVEE